MLMVFWENDAHAQVEGYAEYGCEVPLTVISLLGGWRPTHYKGTTPELTRKM